MGGRPDRELPWTARPKKRITGPGVETVPHLPRVRQGIGLRRVSGRFGLALDTSFRASRPQDLSCSSISAICWWHWHVQKHADRQPRHQARTASVYKRGGHAGNSSNPPAASCRIEKAGEKAAPVITRSNVRVCYMYPEPLVAAGKRRKW